jgi:small subunit ribosomal protein S20
MPNMKSAKKHLITDEKSRVRNKGRRTAIKTAEKNLRTAIEEGDAAKAKDLLSETFVKLDNGVKTGVIHKKKASRKKSQLHKHVLAVK